ncbi:MAG: hypothetical protein FWE37_06350 [Spirochaetaceae bacterium]|nr:hypothetical protein [Spirochaetaceae bacterium]
MAKANNYLSTAFLKHLTFKAYDEESIDEAIALNEKLAYLEDDAETYFDFALTCRDYGDIKRAKEALEAALKLDNDNIDYLQEYALALYDAAAYHEALAVLNRLVKVSNLAPWWLISMLYSELNQYDTALFYASKAVTEQGAAHDYEARAIAYGHLKQTEKALADFFTAINLTDENSELWNNLALFYEEQHLFNEALHAYTRAVTLPYASNFAYFNKAKLELSLGMVNEALYDINEAIKIAPYDAESYNLKGGILSVKEDYAEALKACETAIALNDSIHLQINYAFTLEEAGLTKQAFAKCHELCQRTTREDELQLIIVLLIRLSHYKEAKKQAEKLLEKYTIVQ